MARLFWRTEAGNNLLFWLLTFAWWRPEERRKSGLHLSRAANTWLDFPASRSKHSEEINSFLCLVHSEMILKLNLLCFLQQQTYFMLFLLRSPQYVKDTKVVTKSALFCPSQVQFTKNKLIKCFRGTHFMSARLPNAAEIQASWHNGLLLPLLFPLKQQIGTLGGSLEEVRLLY